MKTVVPPQGLPDEVGWKPEDPASASFTPYIAPGTTMRELTPRAVIVGTILGMIFGASSLYLVLKVGLTVSASIPVAVISITLFRLLSKFGMRDATILENNIVQTAGSAGESIAFGLGVTMPAIMILGFDLEITRVMLVAVLGGLLGILMMIPLRRALIVQQHGYLKYPEGTACAEVLKAGASQESRAAAAEGTGEKAAAVSDDATTGGKIIFAGFGVGFLYYGLQRVFKLWNEEPTKEFGAPFQGGSVALENNPALLGVGYIIGPRIASIMFAGGVLSYLVLIPMIHYFGSALATPLAPESTKLIGAMGVADIQKNYILYIGAGAVAAGGIISLLRSLPLIWHGLKGGLADLRRGNADAGEEGAAPRTDRDLSMKWVIGGIIALVITIMLFPALNMNLLGALLIIIFGFLFVTVSSRLTGEVGSSSNPISGMTVATLLLTCLAFLILGWTTPPYFVTALSVGAIVCIASSNGGTTSQDLKTGFLVGATPKAQQIAILVGALASALLLGPMLLQLNQGSTVYVKLANHPEIGIPADLRAQAQELEQSGGGPKRERARARDDNSEYSVWHKTSTEGGPAGRYLVNDQGQPVYLVDPGINGTFKKTDEGTSVDKFNAPKATLMSYIIKGILGGKLPWGLVLLGVFIAVVLELAGIPSLAFAVGVYLPISASAPIFVGGAVRWLVDRYTRRKFARANLTEEQLVAEGDKSAGVLLASGYIAGAALAGVIYAFLNVKEEIRTWLGVREAWAAANNPAFNGPSSSLIAMIPFVILAVVLYLVGREVFFAPKGSTGSPTPSDLRR